MALFSTSEARALKLGGETPLSNATTYPDGDITNAHARIKERFEEYCWVSFETVTGAVATLNGSGSTDLVLPERQLQTVTAVTIDDAALTAGEVADIEVYTSGVLYRLAGWPRGRRNVAVTFNHGHSAVPSSIKRAALIAAVYDLAIAGNSNADFRAISETNDLGVFRLSVPDSASGRPFGIPEVDAILNQFKQRSSGVGLG